MKNRYKAFPPAALWIILRDGWRGVMTIEHSPLRKLDPMAAHMIFTILGFMWSAIFGIVIADSFTAFGISAVAHIVIISGIFITAIVFIIIKKASRSIIPAEVFSRKPLSALSDHR